MNRILFVDDDPNLLLNYNILLKKMFDVSVASDGLEALSIVEKEDTFDVVVADYRMPKMDGLELVAKIKALSPETICIMLTAYADISVTIDSINKGLLYRYFTKPLKNELLIKAIEDAIEEKKLTEESKLLSDNTLKGTIKLLIEILSSVNLPAFTQATDIRETAKSIAQRMKIQDIWEVEIASLLSQIGCLTLPIEISQKKLKGDALTNAEKKLFLSHPDIGKNLLKHIPRLDKIADAIACQFLNFDGSGSHDTDIKGKDIPLVSRILKVSIDYNDIVKIGKTSKQAFVEMKKNLHLYDPNVLDALLDNSSSLSQGINSKAIPLVKMRIGMVLARDVRDVGGNILVSKGQEISDEILMKLSRYSKKGSVVEPLFIQDIEK